MLSGDLGTMPLADILQWADAGAARGKLVIERPTGEVWIYMEERSVRGMSQSDARSVPIEQINSAHAPVQGLPLSTEAMALECLYDQFLDNEDPFRFDRVDGMPAGGVGLDIDLQLAVMEGMRHLDEWPDTRALYVNDLPLLKRLAAPPPSACTPVQTAILGLAERGVTLGEVRWCLGVSRPACLRNVEALRRLGCVGVEGTPEGGNLIDKLIDKASVLLRAEQYDEAAHVFGALLSAEPGTKRIKSMLRDAERAQVEHLYTRLPQQAVVHATPRLAVVDKRLTRADREVIEHINGRWDVSTLVLASRLREVETLKSIERLHRMEAIELHLPAA